MERKPVDQCADCLLKYKAYLHYDEYLRDGLPIASGVFEEGVSPVVGGHKRRATHPT